MADLAQLAAQRGGALLGVAANRVDGLAGLAHARAEPVDLRADGVEPLAADAELGLQRGRALIDGGEALDEPLPHRPRLGTGAGDRFTGALDLFAEQRRALAEVRDLAAAGAALLAGLCGVLAGRRGGFAGGGSDLTGGKGFVLGAAGLAAGDLELAAEAGDQLAQLLGVGAAALLPALGERDRLVDEAAQRADVVEDGSGAAIDLRDPLQRVLRRREGLLGDAAVLGG